MLYVPFCKICKLLIFSFMYLVKNKDDIRCSHVMFIIKFFGHIGHTLLQNGTTVDYCRAIQFFNTYLI